MSLPLFYQQNCSPHFTFDVTHQQGVIDLAVWNNNKKSQSNLGRSVSSPLTAENNYATMSSQCGMPHICAQSCPFPFRSPPHLIVIPQPTPLTTQNSSQIQSAVLSQYTPGQTERQTDRQTDRWDWSTSLYQYPLMLY